MNKIKIKEYPYALRHMGVLGCGEAVCYLKRKPAFASVIQHSDFINTDGTEVVQDRPFLCGTCGKGGVIFRTPNIFNRKEDLRRRYFNKCRLKGLEDWDWDYE